MKKFIIVCLSTLFLCTVIHAETNNDGEVVIKVGTYTATLNGIDEKCAEDIMIEMINHPTQRLKFGPDMDFLIEMTTEIIDECDIDDNNTDDNNTDDNNTDDNNTVEDGDDNTDEDNDTIACEDTQVDVIFDNDIQDSDWVVSTASLLAMESNCETKVLAVMLTGTDKHEKSGMMYSAVFHYYNRGIPLGMNSRNTMRSTFVPATEDNPTLDSDYNGTYSDITEFNSDNCLDTEPCPASRAESVALLCQILEESDGNITYITGGHLYNLSDILKETVLCDGKTLVSEKITQVVIKTGWDEDAVEGFLEMNLAEGGEENSTAPEASQYVFEHMPSNVKIIIPATPIETNTSLGDAYKSIHSDSPMAFVYAVPNNGTWGDHGIGDMEAILFGVRGDTSNNIHYVEPVESCFHISDEGALSTSEACGKNHFILRSNTSNYSDFIANEARELIQMDISE